MVELDRLASHEGREVRGQILGARHRCAFDEYRHHPDGSLERGRRFESHEVRGIVEPALAVGILGEPVVADDDDQDLAGADGALDRVDEIRARVDSLDVHEHAGGAEVRSEPIVQAAGVAGRVVTPIAYEDAALHRAASLNRSMRSSGHTLDAMANDAGDPAARRGVSRVTRSPRRACVREIIPQARPACTAFAVEYSTPILEPRMYVWRVGRSASPPLDFFRTLDHDGAKI